jgi:cytochrome c oxidase cbb3-type subunit IV
MLKFIKHHMTSIDGIEVYPIISLIIFTLFFAGLIIWVIKTDKNEIKKISRYPLDENNII